MVGRRRDKKLVVGMQEHSQSGVQLRAESFRILHVDDDPAMRDAVDLSLGHDPAFIVLSFGDAREALAAAPDWQPELIICDAEMPGMDWATLLAELRAHPATAAVPAIALAARARPEDVAALKALGAAAVVAKPIDPGNFAMTVQRHLFTIRMQTAGYDFSQRLRRDAAALAAFRPRLGDDSAPQELQSFAHKLAGAAGIFNFAAVSTQAAALENAVIETRAGRGAPETIAANLDALLDCIARGQ